MNEIEVCPECYLSACQKRDNWFCEPCVSGFSNSKLLLVIPPGCLSITHPTLEYDTKFQCLLYVCRVTHTL